MCMIKLAFSLCILLQSAIAFAAMQDGRWYPSIGDPTAFGWLTVFAYLAAVWRCVVKVKESKNFGGSYQFWLYLAIALLFLGINKQLDLQTWLTQTMRDNALSHGWYAYRRPLQLGFIVFLGMGMLIILLSLRLFLANSWRHNKLAWLGVTLLCTFILMRAASFHHLDIFIVYPLFGITINVILEVGAILLIILGTFFDKKSVHFISTNTLCEDYE